MFTVEQVLEQKFPTIQQGKITGPSARAVLRRLLHEQDFREFSERFPHIQGIDFIEEILSYFNLSYKVADREVENIPPAGRVMIIANHPLGSLDGLALLKLVHQVRSDVRIVANDFLMFVKPLRSCLLPVTNIGNRAGRKQLVDLGNALKNEEAVIFFPAGEVSRLKGAKIRDGRWQKGFLQIAEKHTCPILPIYVNARNTAFFYMASTLYKPLSTAMLVNEMFRRKSQKIEFVIGDIIPFRHYQHLSLPMKEKVKLFRKHVYRLGAGKKTIFHTESAIARPERKTEIKSALKEARLLGETPDGKKIYLLQTADSSPIIREIGRLREATFRAVEEGTGRRRDIDRFDAYYKHLVLWDDEELEIVGAYRFVDAGRAMKEKGLKGLYSSSLFTFDESHEWFLKNGLELGRSFVQQKFWGKRSLDYLWYGIGAFLAQHPEQYRFLFGPVSISNSMPIAAKELLIYFYTLYFGPDKNKLLSKNPFSYTVPCQQLADEFSGANYKSDFKRLKAILGNMGTAVPTLYKQYSQLCTPGGVQFLDFNIDPEFSNCVDGLVVVDLHKLKPKKRLRYIDNTILNN